ncbi:acylphosphatase [Virgibacillus natechei]|uniref:Acylphosphatase n=1 Tax=Virgibacillus natechei TaxID=1216297 RepID=A0ABS4IAN3_9BACI|nr:acylphosphatase [Virgibacillus natechei]MBP1967928.1 acylphosphatase [Virgibacillus natechei]UZD14781.1 acylphosphatase [Virgibacillus natechei]
MIRGGKINKYLIVSGRVQGVGFRYSAAQKAKELQLSGWVRNKIDGTVELEVEGDENKINHYIDEMNAGFNQFIQVKDIKEITYQEKGYNNFSIK